MPALFAVGQFVATPGALEVLNESGQDAAFFLDRHVRGDYGEIDTEDRQSNDAAIQEGNRILSAYRTLRGARLWIITEADRSSTCILLPDEY